MTNKRIRYTGIPAYLKLDEAAYIFSISPNTIRKVALDAGALRKINKNTVVNFEKMAAYVETCECFE